MTMTPSFPIQLAAFLLISSLCPLAVHGWGKLGHQAIANVAWDLMNEATKDAIVAILNGSAQPPVHSICVEPCSPLAYVADWADTARYTHDYHWSGPLHFIDIVDAQLPPQCNLSEHAASASSLVTRDWRTHCRYWHSRDCPRDACVAGSIVNYTQQLLQNTSTSQDDDDAELQKHQKVALMFVAHFVGDIHQPLHVSRQSDLGGNTLAVELHNWTTSSAASAPALRGRHRSLTAYPGHQRRARTRDGIQKGLNLHTVWDDTIIDTFLFEKRLEEEEGSNGFLQHHPGSSILASHHDVRDNRTALELELHKLIRRAQGSGTTWALWMACPHGHLTSCTAEWAQESWLLAQERAYVHVGPKRRPVVNSDVLTRTYYQHNRHVVLERLAMAAVRLAATLQVALG